MLAEQHRVDIRLESNVLMIYVIISAFIISDSLKLPLCRFMHILNSNLFGVVYFLLSYWILDKVYCLPRLLQVKLYSIYDIFVSPLSWEITRSYHYIYNGRISPSLNPAKIFQFNFSIICVNKKSPAVWKITRAVIWKEAELTQFLNNAKVNVLFL